MNYRHRLRSTATLMLVAAYGLPEGLWERVGRVDLRVASNRGARSGQTEGSSRRRRDSEEPRGAGSSCRTTDIPILNLATYATVRFAST